LTAETAIVKIQTIITFIVNNKFALNLIVNNFSPINLNGIGKDHCQILQDTNGSQTSLREMLFYEEGGGFIRRLQDLSET
jgi:hypothetical protein